MEYDLSEREVALLQGAARGESARETAETIGVAATYARQLRQEVLKKMQAKNITEAVAIWVREGGRA